MQTDTLEFHQSYWEESTQPILFPALDADITADVVVVGGGIAGLSVAYTLSRKHMNVVVIDNGPLGRGETGRTTAHIANALDDRYTEIEKIFGEEKARLAADSHTAAIGFIEDVVKNEGIACDFLRVPGYLFLHPSDQLSTLENERAATNRCGIQTEFLPSVPGMTLEQGPCLAFPKQAQFHPLKYIAGLADVIVRNGGKIFCNTHASEFGKNEVKANGFSIQADYIVVATNTPVNDRVTMHTKQFPYRTYVIGVTIPKGSLEPALWWDSGNKDAVWITAPYHYVRTQPYTDTHDLLICGGEDHKTGQAGKENLREEERYHLLAHWLKERFPQCEKVVSKWSGQVMEPVDTMGFIGRNPGDENVFIVTGDSGNGMTHGAIAGMLIPDLIMGRDNPWEKLYSPSRITFSVAGDFLKEVGNMAVQYLDYLTPGDVESAGDIKFGDGAIVRAGVKKIAVYKSMEGKLHAFSAVCPHLGCYVRWNGDEKTFDCPCHGSRFSCTGEVINGPAVSPLEPVEMRIEEEIKRK